MNMSKDPCKKCNIFENPTFYLLQNDHIYIYTHGCGSMCVDYICLIPSAMLYIIILSYSSFSSSYHCYYWVGYLSKEAMTRHRMAEIVWNLLTRSLVLYKLEKYEELSPCKATLLQSTLEAGLKRWFLLVAAFKHGYESIPIEAFSGMNI